MAKKHRTLPSLLQLDQIVHQILLPTLEIFKIQTDKLLLERRMEKVIRPTLTPLLLRQVYPQKTIMKVPFVQYQQVKEFKKIGNEIEMRITMIMMMTMMAMMKEVQVVVTPRKTMKPLTLNVHANRRSQQTNLKTKDKKTIVIPDSINRSKGRTRKQKARQTRKRPVVKKMMRKRLTMQHLVLSEVEVRNLPIDVICLILHRNVY